MPSAVVLYNNLLAGTGLRHLAWYYEEWTSHVLIVTISMVSCLCEALDFATHLRLLELHLKLNKRYERKTEHLAITKKVSHLVTKMTSKGTQHKTVLNMDGVQI